MSPRRAHALQDRCAALIIAAVALLVALPAQASPLLPPGPRGWQISGQRAVRGITVGPIESSQQLGRGYGTARAEVLLDELVRLGANWISITPFGRLWSLSSTDISLDFEQSYTANQHAIERMVQQAHARGLRVLLIPHLWVETGGWRGEIDPGTPDRWERYQRSYREFILGWASLAARAQVDAFSIGVECKSWSGRFAPYWSGLIGSVRERFSGLVSYSANWDEAEHVPFWGELDLIGINAFYPLAAHPGASYAEYVEGARRARANVERLAVVHQRPVWFVEVGYTTRRDAAIEPWLWPDDMKDVIYDEHEQARALAAVLEAFAPEPWFAGLFIWRYYADLDDVSQEEGWGFSPHGKLAERVLQQTFHWSWGSDPEMKY
jgi:hypothetical protein